MRLPGLATLALAALAGATALVAGACTRLDAFVCQADAQCVSGGVHGTCDPDSHRCRPPGAGLSLVQLAGDPGLGGGGGIDDVGARARLFFPSAVAPGPGGVLYVTDSGNNMLRTLAPGGRLDRFVGRRGHADHVDGDREQARLDGPSGIVFDGSSAFYVSDRQRHCILRVDAQSGAVTTVAGVPGSFGNNDGDAGAARFDTPLGLALCGGALYIADNQNHAIRRLDLGAKPQVTTFVGSNDSGGGQPGFVNGSGTSARFHAPVGLACDGANLYVADGYNHAIRQVVLAVGAVTTLAGTGKSGYADAPAQFDTPTGVAVDAAGHQLYIVDSANQVVRALDLVTKAVSLVAGKLGVAQSYDGAGSQAAFNFNFAGQLAFSAGRLYLADTGNHAVRQLALDSGAVTTLAGKAEVIGSDDGVGTSARLWYPAGLASDGQGGVLIADQTNCTIRRYDTASGRTDTIAGVPRRNDYADGTTSTALFQRPRALAASGNLVFVADTGNHAVRQIDLGARTVITLAGNGTFGSNDAGAAVPLAMARFYQPSGIAADDAGHVYVADSGNFVIRAIDRGAGLVTTLAGQPRSYGVVDGVGSAARLGFINALALDGQGNLYAADCDGAVVRRIHLADARVDTFAGRAGVPGTDDGALIAATFVCPQGLAVAGNTIYVSDYGADVVRAIDVAAARVTTLAGVPFTARSTPGPLPAILNQPLGLAWVPSFGLVLSAPNEDALLAIR